MSCVAVAGKECSGRGLCVNGAFSNRMFFSKAPQIWTDGDDRDHITYVATVLMAQGWPKPEIIAEQTRGVGVMGLLGGKGDPFFAVVANKARG